MFNNPYIFASFAWVTIIMFSFGIILCQHLPFTNTCQFLQWPHLKKRCPEELYNAILRKKKKKYLLAIKFHRCIENIFWNDVTLTPQFVIKIDLIEMFYKQNCNFVKFSYRSKTQIGTFLFSLCTFYFLLS